MTVVRAAAAAATVLLLLCADASPRHRTRKEQLRRDSFEAVLACDGDLRIIRLNCQREESKESKESKEAEREREREECQPKKATLYQYML